LEILSAGKGPDGLENPLQPHRFNRTALSGNCLSRDVKDKWPCSFAF